MTQETKTQTPNEARHSPVPQPSLVPNFTRLGMQAWHDLAQDFQDLGETLNDVTAIGCEKVGRKIRQMQAELAGFTPSITFIGQIKSGKTSLVNVMAGQPGLLPADVNPWTSVVTSLHLNAVRPDSAPAAMFRFFESDEWEHLVRNGGRIGELSARAGADQEKERLQKQVSEMYEKTRKRLGKSFEMLMGQEHVYDKFDQDLIERYVCLGDAFDPEARHQGQFADITRSADLFLRAEHMPMGCTLRDTPGMNDTFLMREQITIRAVRDARICVVVLSANQALNSVDMGLIRMVSNLKQRQVVIFVNRVDELADPASQIPEIRESLLRTLSEHGGPAAPEVIFGSAMWATAALEDGISDLPPGPAQALAQLGEAHELAHNPRAMAWLLSGVPALHLALGTRVAESSGARALYNIRKRALNVVSSLRASSSIAQLRSNSGTGQLRPDANAMNLISAIETATRERTDRVLTQVFENFGARIDQAHGVFLNRALDGLLVHLERNGQSEAWACSPDGLRMLIRSAYQVMRKALKREMDQTLEISATKLIEAYAHIFDVSSENFSIDLPELPDIPPPVALAQTIVLDVKTAWWKNWWGTRRGFGRFAPEFRDMIAAETAPLLDSIKQEQTAEIRRRLMDQIDQFLSEQRQLLEDICAKADVELDDLNDLFGVTSQLEREDMFELLVEELNTDTDPMGAAA